MFTLFLYFGVNYHMTPVEPVHLLKRQNASRSSLSSLPLPIIILL